MHCEAETTLGEALMRFLMAAIVFPLAVSPARADGITALIVDWQEENYICRGASDPNISEPACVERDKIRSLLLDAGLCPGRYTLDSTDPTVGFMLRERWIPCIYGDLID